MNRVADDDATLQTVADTVFAANWTIVFNFIAALSVAVIYWEVVPTERLGLWVAFIGLIVGWRLLTLARRRAAPDRHPPRHWLNLFALQSGLLGLGWGAVGPLLFLTGPVDQRMLVYMLICGGTAINSVNNSVYTPIFVSYVTTLYVPLGTYLAAQDELPTRVFGLLMVQFVVILLAIGLSVGRTLRTSIGLRFENTRLLAELRASNRDLYQLAITDPLTGAYNRRHVIAHGTHMVEQAQRTQRPLSVLALDLDHFKRLNDHHGHGTGDAAIRATATVCQAALRSTDVLGRVGGEEFTVLLPNTDLQAAEVVAEHLRGAIAALRLPSERGEIHLTASVGVAGWQPGDVEIDSVLQRADRALYRAKAAGRDRVAVENAAG